MSAELEKELEELDIKHNKERVAIILKHRNGNTAEARSKDLLKRLVLSRHQTFCLQKEKDELRRSMNRLQERINIIRREMNSIVIPKLLEIDPTRCSDCGAPTHNEIYECYDDVTYKKPLDYAGNRFFWDVPFTLEERTILEEYPSDFDKVFAMLDTKSKMYPISRYILDAIDDYDKIKKY